MVFVLALFGTPGAGALSSELSGLQTLAGDEQRMVDAVREFDILQQRLADWDFEMAREHSEAGQDTLAKMKIEQGRHRLDLIAEAYELVLSHHKANARANNYYGELLCDRFNEIGQAVALWDLALVLDPDFSPPYNNLGIFYCHVGQYLKGLKHYLAALELEPDNPDYLFNLAQTYLLHGPQVQELMGWDAERVYREAMAASLKAVRLAPQDFELLQDYAMNFFAAENFGVKADWQAAVEAWEAAREHARNIDEEFNTWVNQGRVHKRQGNNDEAAHCFRQALQLRPQSELVRQLLAEPETETGSRSAR